MRCLSGEKSEKPRNTRNTRIEGGVMKADVYTYIGGIVWCCTKREGRKEMSWCGNYNVNVSFSVERIAPEGNWFILWIRISDNLGRETYQFPAVTRKSLRSCTRAAARIARAFKYGSKEVLRNHGTHGIHGLREE